MSALTTYSFSCQKAERPDLDLGLIEQRQEEIKKNKKKTTTRR